MHKNTLEHFQRGGGQVPPWAPIVEARRLNSEPAP